MTEHPDDSATAPVAERPSTEPNPNKPAPRQSGKQKRGGRGRSAYAFPDELERCFCRNATRVPPQSFPVAAREGVAKPAMCELVRTDTRVLFCDLLHEGPHMWPDGEEFVPA